MPMENDKTAADGSRDTPQPDELARKWNKLLLLTGPSAADQQRAAVAQAAIKRYGLQVVAAKPFKLSADPRERQLANPLLLTGTAGGLAYDVARQRV
mgnify:CR=1 FL=1